MRKYYGVFLVLCFTIMIGKAQDLPHLAGCIKYDSSQANGLNDRDFKKILNRQFTNLISGQSRNSVGNYASVDTKLGSATISNCLILNNGSVVNVIFSGAASDGYAAIFTNSKLNTAVSLECQYNFLANARQCLRYNPESLENYLAEEKQIKNKFIIDSLLIRSSYRKIMIDLDSKIASTDSMKRRLDNSLISREILDRDSLNYLSFKTCIRLDSLQTVKNTLQEKGVPELIEDAQTKRNELLKKLEPDFDISGHGFGWFSLSGKVQNNSFYLFDPSAAYANQISKGNFVQYEVGAQYSYYMWSSVAFESYYYCCGASFSYSDNLPDLRQTEISDIKYYGPNLNDRLSIKKYNAYVGKYRNNIEGVRLYCDVYKFLFDDNIAAFHLYPDLQIRDAIKPVWNVGLGLLMSFKSSKDASSNVNVELYYVFSDIANVMEENNNFIERNSVGIRLAFPITFKTN
jgi:hypothetical protein